MIRGTRSFFVCGLGVPALLSVKFISAAASGLYHAIFVLVMSDRFGLSAADNGLVTSYVGFLSMLSQAFLIEWATSRFTERGIVITCTIIMAISFGAMSMATTVLHCCLILVHSQEPHHPKYHSSMNDTQTQCLHYTALVHRMGMKAKMNTGCMSSDFVSSKHSIYEHCCSIKIDDVRSR
ncbi:hypothetical protein CYMTET_52789 [Cymbomonas tetramitiformis]|uniref:Uncharacterized protein n=1 Tax=Cymbomonas tetramitiformis TaxID=36881 RepID=A0AAE0BJN3_9CHLO|nr:hypothetical protein CYMTET_52789 [Cymbomonas tetramitiformis]